MPVQSTNIAWCDDSANHWVGCAKVSEGCTNCWAAAVADRFDRTPEPWTIDNIDANLRVYEEDIGDLLARRDPGWCFFPSSSDPFLPWLPRDAYRDWRFAIQGNRQHCFQVLTKWGPEVDRSNQGALPGEYIPNTTIDPLPPNAMLGVTVESPLREYRLDWLREQPAETKFVSFEPLIERIPDPDLSGIDWAIIGGESGPKAVRRPMDPAWAVELIEACREQDVAPFFKQHSDRYPEERTSIDLGDGPVEVREFPDVPDSVPASPREFLTSEVVA